MKIEGTINVNFEDIVNALKASTLSNAQKVKLAKEMSDFFGTIDMDYIEKLLVMAADMRLKAIKKNKDLYHRNRPYFNALKIIKKVKSAE